MNKPRANRLGMYADVRAILDAALASGGGTYECGTYGQAVHWRQRAYRFRKVYAETLGLRHESPYDCLTMPRIDSESTTVTIQVRKQVGVFLPIVGGEPAGVIMIDNDLLGIASELAEKIDKGEV